MWVSSCMWRFHSQVAMPASDGLSSSLVFLITNQQPRCSRPPACASILHARGCQHFLVQLCLNAQAHRPLPDPRETGNEWLRTDHPACLFSPPGTTAQGEMGDSEAWILPRAPAEPQLFLRKSQGRFFKLAQTFFATEGEAMVRKWRERPEASPRICLWVCTTAICWMEWVSDLFRCFSAM